MNQNKQSTRQSTTRNRHVEFGVHRNHRSATYSHGDCLLLRRLIFLADLLDGRHETVSAPGNRFHIARAGGRISQRFPYLVDGRVQTVIEIDKCIRRPKFLAKVIPRHHLAGVIQQKFQYLEGLFLQSNSAAAFAQLSR